MSRARQTAPTFDRKLALTLCVVLGCGCSGSKDDPGRGGGAGTDDGGADSPWPDTDTGDPAWILPEDDAPDADPIDSDAVAAQLRAAITAIAGVSAAPLLPALEDTLAGAEPGCPDWFTDEAGTPYWADTCATASGASYAGYAMLYVYEDYADSGVTWDGFGVAMAGRAETPTGDTLEMNGWASFLQGVEDSGSWSAYSAIEAGQRWSAATEPWLSAGDGPAVSWYAVGAPDRSGGAVSMSARVEPEDSFTAVIFEDLLFITESWGSSCPDEPHGAVSVLAADGRWLELEFDGPDWGGAVDAALCDGCGRAFADGVAVGEVCVDFGAVSDPGAWPLWTGPFR